MAALPFASLMELGLRMTSSANAELEEVGVGHLLLAGQRPPVWKRAEHLPELESSRGRQGLGEDAVADDVQEVPVEAERLPCCGPTPRRP